MLVRLVRPMKREGSSNKYFVQRIPADVKASAAGMTLRIPVGETFVPVNVTDKTPTVRLSLRTSDLSEAKVRQATVAAHLERVWRSLREQPRTLTLKEAVALAGEVYKAFAGVLEDDPGEAEMWRRVREDNAAAAAGQYGMAALLIGDDARKAAGLEERFGAFADVVLARKGIRVDAVSRLKLLQQVAGAMDEAAEKLQRNAEGDYRADENVSRFPEWEAKTKPAAPITGATITGIRDGWAKEATATGKASVSALRAYDHSIRKLVEFLGHDAAARVTPENVVAFKDARLGEINLRTGRPISAKTVNDGDLTALKTVFGWAVKNRKLTSNPAAGITVTFAKPVRLRQKGFTETEASAVLRHASSYKPAGREAPKTTVAKRWAPWLCAYTGARIGEMLQLRKEDLRREGKVYILRITPEAGTVKGRKFRDVPLHPHLVELGFPAFVEASSQGYLFITPTEKGGWRGPWHAIKNRVGEFVREVVSDPQVQPNHGWRHRFITLCREHGVDQEIRRMITGHKGEGVDEVSYGDPAGLYREICKLPRYRIG
jgi:integrase